jgi:hypothetical protein
MDPDDPVALEWAPNPFVAELWMSLLDDAGIPAYVDGASLMDENAVAQRLLGAIGQTVFVRRSDVDRAREVIADARRRAPHDEEDGDAAGERSEDGAT